MRVNSYINGEWVDGTGKPWVTKNPKDGSLVSEGQFLDVVQWVPALAKATEAGVHWGKEIEKNQSQFLMVLMGLIEREFDKWALAERDETGLDTTYLDRVQQKLVSDIKTRMEPIGHAEGFPVGLQLMILPSVGSLECAVHMVMDAVASGNPVVIVPSRRSVGGVYEFIKSLSKIDLPVGLVNFCILDATEREMLIQHPAIRQVVVVGRPETGKALQKLLVGSDKKLIGIHGGKNTSIVLPDANIKAAASHILKGAFTGSGSLGVSISRVLVSQKIFAEFESELTAQMNSQCESDSPSAYLGALANNEIEERLQKVLPELESSEGKKILSWSYKGESSDYSLYRHVSFCSEWQQQFVDAPVLLVNDFKYNHEAVKWANTTPYGLTASVFTEDHEGF
ncbi:MAG: aldehyde dehydrogenase [Bdellovibrionales bacterium]